MRLAVLCTPERRACVIRACAGRVSSVLPITSLQSAPQAIDVVVADPLYVHAPPVREALVRFADANRHVGVVVFGDLTRELSRTAIAIAAERRVVVGLAYYDDADAIWSAIREAYASSLGARVAWLVEPTIARTAGHDMAAVVCGVLAGTLPARTVPDLARAAAVDRRTFYRRLARAGIGAPKDLLRAARVLAAVPLIARRSIPLSDVALRAGYSDYGRFLRHTRRVLGHTPSELRESVPLTVLSAAAIAHLLHERADLAA